MQSEANERISAKTFPVYFHYAPTEKWESTDLGRQTLKTKDTLEVNPSIQIAYLVIFPSRQLLLSPKPETEPAYQNIIKVHRKRINELHFYDTVHMEMALEQLLWSFEQWLKHLAPPRKHKSWEHSLVIMTGHGCTSHTTGNFKIKCHCKKTTEKYG